MPLLSPGVPAAPPAEYRLVSMTGDDPVQDAKRLRYAERWYEAAILYRRYLQDNPVGPRSAEVRFWLANTLHQDQRWDEAALAYTEFLRSHPDERMLGKEARLNRIQCWGIRQGQNQQATPGLLSALEDAAPEIRAAAALQLAKVGERRAVPALQAGLALPRYSEACRLALLSLGQQPDTHALPAQGRFLVLKIKGRDKPDEVTVRIALGLARAVTSYLSEEQLKQMNKKGIDARNLMDLALSAPKGTELFSVEDKDSSIRLLVE